MKKKPVSMSADVINRMSHNEIISALIKGLGSTPKHPVYTDETWKLILERSKTFKTDSKVGAQILSISKSGVASVVGSGKIDTVTKGRITKNNGEEFIVDITTKGIGLKISRKKPVIAANPAWVMDHAIWVKAKKRAPGAPWGVIANIYKIYGGRVKGQAEVSGEISAGEKFIVVTKPTPNSELVDIMFETDFHGLELQFKGGLKSDQIVKIFTLDQKTDAFMLANSLLAKRPQVGAASDDQLAKGIEVEKEHAQTLQNLYDAGARDALAGYHLKFKDQQVELAVKSIAKDHLREIPDYYDRLAKMEAEAKR